MSEWQGTRSQEPALQRNIMKRMVILITLAGALCASMTYAKRAAPKEVLPVEHAGVQYVVTHFGLFNGTGHNGGYIEARDKKSSKKLWGLQVYKTKYDKGLERDVQDVFISSITLNKDKTLLIVKNERGKVYHVDIVKKAVVPNPEDSGSK